MNQNNQDKINISEPMLTELLLSKSKFIGKLVHNLKNPVGSGLSFSEMILDDLDQYSPEKLKRHLSIIKGSCEAALTQLEVLVIESKLETKTLDLYLQEALFSELIKKGIEQNNRSIEKNNIAIHYSLLDYEPTVNIDKNLINHLLQSIFQFYFQNASSNTILQINLNRASNDLILTLTSKNCEMCLVKFDELKSTINNHEKKVFSSVNKNLSLSSMVEIAKLHQGAFKISAVENNAIEFKLSLPISL